MNSPQWRPEKQFQLAAEALPLISVDLCLINDGHMLLGKRNKKSAQGWRVTLGGRLILPCGDGEQHSQWRWAPIDKVVNDAHVH